MAQAISDSEFEAALRAVEAEDATPEEKTEMLMEVAMGMQTRPKTSDQLRTAIQLYERALATCPVDAPLLGARVRARMGTALQALPDTGFDALRRARACYEEALPNLKSRGRAEEAAETELNLGLVMQALVGSGEARIVDAVQCYHRALRVFTREAFPQEYAILHNNLAIAYLSIPLSDERGKMREALAVQSFEEVLKVVTLVDHPTEYAMIQNNLGNALQYASSGHALDNNIRALAAYDEALKIRNPRDTPLEYANTISNRANVLRSLPDDFENSDLNRRSNLSRAQELYREALGIFERSGQSSSALVVKEALDELNEQLNETSRVRSNGDGRLSA